ncbi:phage replisome organizer N-terminal domain-containing protein [Clostridium sp. Mt-5]|uniref:Phage replisome organizer N-terminal domain-containing protein n=1 Tax=Clostridium moutaii TaxID=3240932 RepID=A0ABV4BXJ1_9CLOT
MADVKWIKIVTDIFDDEKILLIESLPEADAIIVIWFKLLCLAGKNNNKGVFVLNDKIPYTDEMLATIFRRPLNTVRLALKVFEQYKMIEIIEGVITIPNWSKHQTLDQIESRREYQREYMARKRYEQKLIAERKCEPNSKTNCEPNSKTNVSPIEGEEERDRDKDNKEIDIENTNRVSWQEILTAWNDLPSPINPIRSITNKRKDKIKARMNSLKLKQEDIMQAINNIKNSNFTQGKNNRNWVIDFEWLFKDDTNFSKVLEGKYNGNKPTSKGQFNNFKGRDYSKEQIKDLESKLLGY